MKKLPKISVLLVVLFTLVLTSCEVYDDPIGFVEQEYRATPYFDGLDVPGNVDVIIRQGNRRDIIIEADSRTIYNVDTYVRQNTLIIRKVGGWSSPVKVYVQVPDLRFISVSGTGAVFSETVWVVPNMELKVLGSGSVDIGLDVRDNVDVSLTGSGKVFLEGNTRQAYYEIAGSGLVQAFGLYANRAEVVISGSGSCELTARSTLDVDISGSGVAYFKGYPSVKSRISGRGELFDAN